MCEVNRLTYYISYFTRAILFDVRKVHFMAEQTIAAPVAITAPVAKQQHTLHAKFHRKHISRGKNVPTFVYSLTGSTAALAAFKAAQGWKSADEPGYYREDNGVPLFFTTRTNLMLGGDIIVTVNGKIAIDDTMETFEDAALDKIALRNAVAAEEAKGIVAARGGANRRFGTRTPSLIQAIPNTPGNDLSQPINSTLEIPEETEEQRLMREAEAVS